MQWSQVYRVFVGIGTIKKRGTKSEQEKRNYPKKTKHSESYVKTGCRNPRVRQVTAIDHDLLLTCCLTQKFVLNPANN